MGILLEVNGKKIEAEKGESILSALNRHGMQVPTLCTMKDLSPSGACRMCVVEVEGRESLVPSCSFPLEEALSISTHSPRVLRARQTNVELLLSNHPDDCLYCERNGSCELQDLAEDLNIRERRIPGKKRLKPVDRSSPAIIRDPSKCILCGRCVRICEELMCTSVFDFAHRGNELSIATTLDKPLDFTNCTACGQCVAACPTGALIEHVQFPELEALVHDPSRTVAVQYSPAVSVSLAELLGLRPGTDLSSTIAAALRNYGVDLVLETALGADVLMVEQAKLFAERLKERRDLPLITSSCPAWVQYAEQYYPELLSCLSPLKSPQQILGCMVGKKIPDCASVVISSCTAAKKEALRKELGRAGAPVNELVMTTRELARLIRLSGLDPEQMESEEGQDPFPGAEGAGNLCGVAGGELEALMRTVHPALTGKPLPSSSLQRLRISRPLREWTFKAGGQEIRIASVSGMVHVVALLEEVRSGKRKLDLLEVMACPGGCINGGGQPFPPEEQSLRTRTKALYEKDKQCGAKASHLATGIDGLHRASRGLLFTTFSPRGLM